MLPALTLAEALETTRLHRVAGRIGERMGIVTLVPQGPAPPQPR
jgi:hypothetical protein